MKAGAEPVGAGVGAGDRSTKERSPKERFCVERPLVGGLSFEPRARLQVGEFNQKHAEMSSGPLAFASTSRSNRSVGHWSFLPGG